MAWTEITTKITGETVTAAEWNDMAANLKYLEEHDYEQITSDASVTGTSEVDIISLSTLTYEAGDYWLEFYSIRVTAGGAGNFVIEIKDGTTYYGRGLLLNTSQVANPCFFARRVTLSAGSHTLRVVGQNGSSQTTTVSAGAGNADTTNPPAFLRCTPVIPTT